jgi:hypothetical protein
MAISGRKPKPPGLKLVTGNPGRRPLPEGDIDVREAPLEPPKRLNKAQQRYWDRWINTAWWLDEHDVPKAFMWVCLSAEYEKSPADMVASRIANLRALGSELGLDPASRTRMAGSGGSKADPSDEFFS